MWRFPRSALAWLLVTDVCVLAWTCWAASRSPVGWRDVLSFGVLAVCAGVHVASTAATEERSFGRQPRGHVDQTSIWVFTGGLTLPVPLLVALVALIRFQRYRIARKAPYRFIFSSAGILASALAVHAISEEMPLRSWLTGRRALPHTQSEALVLLGGIVAAVATYFLVQAVIVGLANGLTDSAEARARARRPSPSSAPAAPAPVWTLENLVGDRASNVFILVTLAVAVGATVAHSVSPFFVLAFVPVAVRFTRTEQNLKSAYSKAHHDTLTGLLNRNGFDPAAELELLAGTRAGRSTALLFLDIDHFGAWNGKLGHLGGDQVLQAVGRVIESQVRDGDLSCRWGGEEFAVLLPAADQHEAQAVAERIRYAFATMRFVVTKPAGGEEVLINDEKLDGAGFTCSIGIALSPEHGIGLTELEDVASLTMKTAKQGGRNQVAIAPGATRASHASDEMAAS
ncbi:GGDEF domain-containing protein [Amycolatopsis sp. VC5-11]|uniref:GGDEF domain-containing protein n=1 Tax=Amycolatopsis sp. VC5-11 TaxID=3120156 RepID=UPI00300B1D27